ncbi:4a-hydroxytetrahydrobiopterin dehydratase [Amphritea sp.]|uniref:4a-hydroxytetrahydrobiopterin dehydratase n=1 Tax=Amphritea sp. TaxID=1872502 RepID=UPI003A8EAF77
MHQSSGLKTRHCLPYQGLAELSPEEAQQRLGQLASGWSIGDGAKVIHKLFQFNDFHHTMAFVNALAWIAQRENHHPDLEVSYARCRVRYTTHVLGGLSENDFICAAMIDALDAE